jgi:hypothetical protein
MSKRIKLFMAHPSVGTRADIQCYTLREMEKRYKDRIEFVYPKQCVQRIFHDAARNGMVEEFLETDCDALWFLDADVSPPSDGLDFFLEETYDQWDLAGLPYPVFMTPHGYSCMQAVVCVYNHDGIGLKPARVPREGIRFVDGLATGCLFIKRKIFTEIERPWFEFKYDPTSRQMVEGEDLGFCLKVNALGYKFLTDFSKVCSHFKSVDLLHVMGYATQYAQTHVDALHAEYRPRIKELALEVGRLRNRPAPSKIAPASMSDLLAIKNSLPPSNRGPKP